MTMIDLFKGYTIFRGKQIWQWLKNLGTGLLMVPMSLWLVLYYIFRLIVGLIALFITRIFFNVLLYSIGLLNKCRVGYAMGFIGTFIQRGARWVWRGMCFKKD